MAPSAKRIVLELLTAAHPNESPVAQLVRACDVVGVDDNNVRVILARLVAAGTVELAGRGVYRLGRAARPLTEQVLSWRELDKQVRRWDGGWAFVQLAHLSRSDRAALRRRERALRLLGFRELERGLAVRPDNLVGGVAGLRDRLVALGVDDQAIVTRASELDDATEARARRLWDAERLTQSYRQTAERIERWLVAAADCRRVSRRAKPSGLAATCCARSCTIRGCPSRSSTCRAACPRRGRAPAGCRRAQDVGGPVWPCRRAHCRGGAPCLVSKAPRICSRGTRSARSRGPRTSAA